MLASESEYTSTASASKPGYTLIALGSKPGYTSTETLVYTRTTPTIGQPMTRETGLPQTESNIPDLTTGRSAEETDINSTPRDPNRGLGG